MTSQNNSPTSQEIVLKAGDTIVGVMAEQCLVSQFQVGDWPVLYRAEETQNIKRWGIPLMIPNFGRLKDGLFQEKGTILPMHGFGRNLPWTTVNQDATSVTIQLTANEQTRQIYPYEFVFTVHVTVAPGTLTYTLTIENRSDKQMPISPGLHPYFTVAQQDKKSIKVSGLDEFHPETIDWNTQPPDNHYLFPHQVRVTLPHEGHLTIAEQPVNGTYALAHMQVWSEPVTAADHAFVCFEPIVAYEGGINRPQDRLNIAPKSSQQIIVLFTAQPM